MAPPIVTSEPLWDAVDKTLWNAQAAQARHPDTFAELDLSRTEPVAWGSERCIYLHPFDGSLLIKVINGPGSRGAERQKRWHKRFHREGQYRVFLSELTEYATVAIAMQDSPAEFPLARIAGMVSTTLGMGLLVEKIVDENGKLAPTLHDTVATHGLSAQLRRQLDGFFSVLCDSHVIFNDVGPRNIAIGCNAAGRHGLYLIDGFGAKQFIPLYAWSKTLNRRRLERKYAQMLERMQELRPADAGAP